MRDKSLFLLTCYFAVALFISLLGLIFKFKLTYILTTSLQITMHACLVLIPYFFLKRFDSPNCKIEIHLISQFINIFILLMFSVF